MIFFYVMSVIKGLTVIIGCVHVPYNHKLFTSKFFKFLELNREGIGRIIILGDLTDYHIVGDFKETLSEVHGIQEEVDKTRRFLRRIRNTLGDVDIQYLRGNHEARIERELLNNKKIRGLRCLRVEQLLKLDDLGIVYHDRDFVKIGGINYCHGNKASKYAMNAMLDRFKAPVIFSHSHRAQYQIETLPNGMVIYAASTGTFHDMTQQKFVQFPNWHYAFICLERGLPEFANYINGSLFFRGKIY